VRAFERRRFLIAAGAMAAAPLARPQDRRRLPVLGILSSQHRPPASFISNNPFSNRLRALGWIEGQTLAIERAYGEGREERLPGLAEELARKRVDVIWAIGPEAAVAAARATRSIPVVFWGVPFPVEQGLVDTIASPGRNVTGVAWYAGPGVDTKRLEALREIAPHAKRLAYLNVPTAGATVSGDKLVVALVFRHAAALLGFEIHDFPVATAADLQPAFDAILAWGAQALVVSGTIMTLRERHRIVAFANRHRLPSCFTGREFSDAGGLVSYAIVSAPTLERCAEQIDQILRGARPAELPVDIPQHYELILNLKTANALGLTIPQSLLLRADRVIE
jgi:putative ABC transport system substrate-binding protein